MKLATLSLLLAIIPFSFSTQEEVIDAWRSVASDHVIGAWKAGLGSCLHAVLNHLSYCEINKKIPIVYWDKRSYYFNPQGFNGKQNVWEYYFEPVSSHAYVNGLHIDFSYNPLKVHNQFYYNKISDRMRHEASRLIKKYIKPNPIVQEKVDIFHETYMEGNKHIVGIHLRGTDKYLDEKLINPKRIVDEALRYAQEDTLFLVSTDEQELLNAMIELLEKAGKKVIYYDCYRSEDGSPLHIHNSLSSAQKPSYAQLGEDVLVEMLLLARCDLLVHSLSNVSSCSLYFNADMRHVTVR